MADERKKRPCEPQAACRLEEAESSVGIGDCRNGSGNGLDRSSGNAAGSTCTPTGNSARYSCATGLAGAA